MTTSIPKHRRRTPWIIGAIVLVGIGMVVGGNWTSIRLRFSVLKLRSAEDTEEFSRFRESVSLFQTTGNPAFRYAGRLLGDENTWVSMLARTILHDARIEVRLKNGKILNGKFNGELDNNNTAIILRPPLDISVFNSENIDNVVIVAGDPHDPEIIPLSIPDTTWWSTQ